MTVDTVDKLERYNFPGPDKAQNAFWGEELLAAFEGLMHSPIQEELDELLAEGDISGELAAEYAMQLPEYHELRNKLRSLADEFALRLMEKAPRYLEQMFTEGGQISEKGAIKGFAGMQDFLKQFKAAYQTDELSSWNGRTQEFYLYLMQALYLTVPMVLACKFQNEPAKRIFASHALHQFYYYLPHPITGLQGVHSFAYQVHSGVSTLEHMSHFAPWKEIEADLIQEDIPTEAYDELFERVSELSQFRTLPGEKFTIGQYEFHLEGIHDPRLNVRTQHMAFLSIYNQGQCVLKFCMDRASGDLFIADSTVCLGSFMDVKAYWGLKALILKRMELRLEHLPEDVPSHVVYITTTREEVQAACADQLPNIVQFPEEKARPSFNLARLRNLDAGRVLRALNSLLGPPVRVRGSHYVFRIENGTHPISLHKGSTVKTGLLRSCLVQMGIDPEEFLAHY